LRTLSPAVGLVESGKDDTDRVPAAAGIAAIRRVGNVEARVVLPVWAPTRLPDGPTSHPQGDGSGRITAGERLRPGPRGRTPCRPCSG
jgi:hypothetical protein